MDNGALQSFYEKAEADLAGIRNGILIFVQDHRSAGELVAPIRDLNALKQNAHSIGLDDIEALFARCERVLTDIHKEQSTASERGARIALDLIAEIEGSLLRMPIRDEGFFTDISDFVDESFDNLTQLHSSALAQDEARSSVGFEIDEETLEIFRSEASDLLDSISGNLDILTAQPHDREALWNVRRCAHTFKGAAGIVGMKEASKLAHRLEDLLDQLAENRYEVDAGIIDLLVASTECLSSLTIGSGTAKGPKDLAAIYADFDRIISKNAALSAKPDRAAPKYSEPVINGKIIAGNNIDPVKMQPAPIVRVSLDRLDELLKITRNLAINRSALAERFGELGSVAGSDQIDAGALKKVASLFEIQRRLTSEMQEKLRGIRMVRFGMLTTRLDRAVHVTCQEENKKAEIRIENEDVEIDTQILDSLVEPLLHLLRNAVVHGIESPERRRLIGKSEKGQICVGIVSGDDEITVLVSDDGRGISAAKLKEKALVSGAIRPGSVDSLSDEETFDLIFLRGVTTAETLNLNAGRGVGMSIVKESVEANGGSISIATEAQKGTTFTIKIPFYVNAAPVDPIEDDDEFFSANSASYAIGENPGLHVLIVDDSASMRQMTSRMIENAGWKASTATDGRSALELLKVPENRPDIILTDLEMPGLNGYELLESLKYDDDLHEIPIIMITSRSDEAHRQKAFDLGVADFLTKPFEEGSLITAIHHLGVAIALP